MVTVVASGYVSVDRQYPDPSNPESHRTSPPNVPLSNEKLAEVVFVPQVVFVCSRSAGVLPLGATFPAKQFCGIPELNVRLA
jgi:hypothetical protein